MGIAHTPVRDSGISRIFATSRAIKNHTTPMLRLPHGVVGPYTSAQHIDNALVITGFQLSCLAKTIKISQRTIMPCVNTNGQYSLLKYFFIEEIVASLSTYDFEKYPAIMKKSGIWKELIVLLSHG